MNDILENLKRQFKTGGMYIKLIYINVAVFIIFALVEGLGVLLKIPAMELAHYHFTLNTSMSQMLYQPWGWITYMFFHAGVFHLAMNMMMLFYIGKILETYLGGKKVLSIYILGGLAGALVQVVAKNSFPALREQFDYPVLGASGAVIALAVATVTYAPKLEVYLFGSFKLKLLWIVGFFVLQDMLQMSRVNGDVASFTHLGGALFGFLMITKYKKGKDITKWFDPIAAYIKTIFKKGKSTKMKVKFSKPRERKKATKTPPRDDYDYNANKVAQQKKIDAILDKIKYKGYDGLTKKEKDFLNSIK